MQDPDLYLQHFGRTPFQLARVPLQLDRQGDGGSEREGGENDEGGSIARTYCERTSQLWRRGRHGPLQNRVGVGRLGEGGQARMWTISTVCGIFPPWCGRIWPQCCRFNMFFIQYPLPYFFQTYWPKVKLSENTVFLSSVYGHHYPSENLNRL